MNIVSGLVKGFKQVREMTKVIGLRVVSVQSLTPHMVRVMFEAEGLERFDTLEQLHVRLHLPPPGAAKTNWLDSREDGSVSPREGIPKAFVRKYTVRSVDPASGRVAIDFVVHGDTGPGGLGLEHADWYLLAGDETALPAIARMLEGLPDAAQGYALIEAADHHEQQGLRKPAGVALRWLYRDGADAGTTTLLHDAVQEIAWPERNLSTFAWVGTEAAATQTIRAYLRQRYQSKLHRQLVVAHWQRDEKH